MSIKAPFKATYSAAFNTLNAQELLFDNVHYAYGSTKYNDTAIAVNGDPVGAIADLKGSSPLTYYGLATPAIGSATLGAPTLTGIPPALADSKFIEFLNQPNTWYESALLGSTISPPMELWLVSRIMPGQGYESRMQGGGNVFYIGDFNRSSIRIVDAGLSVPSSTFPANYYTNIERIVFKAGDLCDYWINNVFIGEVDTSSLPSYEKIKQYHTVGVFTNGTDHDWAAQYFKVGTAFDNTTATTIYNSLAAKWNVGVLPNQVLLSNLTWTRSGSSGSYQYTPSCTVLNTPAGVTVAAQNTWDYQWHTYTDQTNYNIQTLRSTNMVLNQTDFPADNGTTITGTELRFSVRPKIVVGGVPVVEWNRYFRTRWEFPAATSSVTP